MEQLYAEVIAILKERKPDAKGLALLKRQLCQKHGVKKMPSNIEILLHATKEDLQQLKLVTKPVRSMSGVAVVTIMTAPFACPHGKCTFCPGGPNSFFGNVPQSYTGNEPASMRAIRAHYDPYAQVFNRMEQYVVTGHSLDKIELIFNGGTFPAMPEQYQGDFVTYALKALNDFGDAFFSNGELDMVKFKEFFELPGNFKDAERVKRVQQKIRGMKGSSSLETEQLRNETAKARCVAFCIETKPDWSKEKHIDTMLRFGTTRVEMGIQTLSDEILRKTHRGHTLADSMEATRLLKDAFLKCCYHIMPGLPLSSREQDIAVFKKLFANADYRPDALKIYPTMVMPGTALWAEWKAGRFTPLTLAEAADIIAEGKRYIPEYCRVMRVQRDIPTKVTSAGVERTNLRQYVSALLRERNINCTCIRCREPKEANVDIGDVKIKKKMYGSSGGDELFLAAEEQKTDKLIGFCRLRIPGKPFRPEITAKSAGIRELHVYGEAAGIGKEGAVQHRGIGRQLVAEAERLAKEEFGCTKLLIISGIGVKEYYRKLGYAKDGVYVSKALQ